MKPPNYITHKAMFMHILALDLANRMIEALLSLPDDLKLKAYQKFIFTRDDGDEMMGADVSDFMPDDEGLKAEIKERFCHWDLIAVDRFVRHTEAILLVSSKDMNDKLIMSSVNNDTYTMETIPSDGYYLSVTVKLGSYHSFTYHTDKEPLDYLFDSITDVEVELLEG